MSQAEFEAARLRDIYQQTSRIAKIGGWEVNLKTQSLWWSDETRTIHEVTADFIPDLATAINFYHEEDRATLRAAVEAAMASGTPYDLELRIYTAQGNLRWVRGVCVPHRENGKTVLLRGTFQDITERKQAQEALKASEMRFKEILQGVETVAVQGYAMDGTVRYWNKAATLLYGYTEAEALGRNLLDLIIPPAMRPAVREEIRKMEKTLQPIPSGELSLMRKDGSTITVYSSHSLVRVPGAEMEFFCIDVDISERKQLEDALSRALKRAEAANYAKTQFLANMSHELRTPMNGVIGITEILLNTSLSTEQREFAKIIQTSGDHLLSIVNDLISFASLESGKISLKAEKFNLFEFIDLLRLQYTAKAQEKGLEFLVCMAEDLPKTVYGDVIRLRQVLNALLGNAIKFTHQGSVTLGVKLESAAAMRIRFTVEDTGIGIAPEQNSVIFERFHQVDSSLSRKYGGTGLGLSIAKDLVGLLNGEIGLTSKLGHGSAFYCVIPMAAPR